MLEFEGKADDTLRSKANAQERDVMPLCAGDSTATTRDHGNYRGIPIHSRFFTSSGGKDHQKMKALPFRGSGSLARYQDSRSFCHRHNTTTVSKN